MEDGIVEHTYCNFIFHKVVSCFFQMDLTLLEELLRHIDCHDSSFCVAVIAIIFNPFFWNVVSATVEICYLAA